MYKLTDTFVFILYIFILYIWYFIFASCLQFFLHIIIYNVNMQFQFFNDILFSQVWWAVFLGGAGQIFSGKDAWLNSHP